MKSKGQFISLIGLVIMTGIFACVHRLFDHHWPNEMMLLGWMLGWVLIIVAQAYSHVVKLMERQNALLEQVLGVLKEDQHQYEEPLGRR